MQDLTPLMERLSYTFRRPELLAQALTHPSMGQNHNQRLEFLGDAVLQLIISDMLYATHPADQEGGLTHLRQLLVCETALSQVASHLGLGQYLVMDHGEELSGGREKPSVLCDTMEAVLAAVYLDGGMQEAVRIVKTFWPRADDVKLPMQDSKNMLQERLQAQGGEPPVYTITEQSGPAHNPLFHAVVSRNHTILGSGTGKSKKEAEKAAALDALKKLENRP